MRRISSLGVEHVSRTTEPDASGVGAGAGVTVLVVDDNPATRRFLRETLEIEGYTVVEAAGGAEALQQCAEGLPDLVIIDLCMGDMAGTEVVAALRTRPGAHAVPVIVFTGAPEDLPDDHRLAGFDDLIAKPADADVLLETVRAHVVGTGWTADASRLPSRRRILVVDGELPRSMRTRLLLRRMGFDVTIATTAGEALRSATVAPPDLMVADLVLADMTALELTRSLRADPRLAGVPVVLTSPAPWSEAQERLAERVGATASVTITPGLDELRATVVSVADAGGIGTPEPAAHSDALAEQALRDFHRQEAERRDAARSVERGKAELAVLQGLSDVLADPSDLDTVLTEALARSLHAIGASRGAVFLAEVDGRFSMCAHLGDLDRLPGGRIAGSDGLFQRVVDTGETLVLDVVSGRPQAHADDSLPPPGRAATVLAPVASAGERFGALAVEVPAHEDLRFWMHFLKLVGLGLGFAVANSRRAGLARQRDAVEVGSGRRDPLTGLAGPERLEDELAAAMAKAGPRSHAGALLLVDIDRLRHVNDALGRATGDELLRGVARRLEGAAGPHALVCRLDGDLYAVLVHRVTGVDGARAHANRLMRALDAPIRCSGYTLYATASVGVAVFPDHAGAPRDLIRNAHTAVSAAKERGGDAVEVYSAESGSSSWQRLTVDQGLRAALERDEFALHYQPIVDMWSGQIDAAEALLRWDRPVHGVTSAADFIKVAEETGLIVPLGAWVLRHAAHQVGVWTRSGVNLRSVAVNVGARELHEGDVYATVSRVLDESGIEASMLCLEITETVALADVDHAVAVLDAVRGLGVRVALDDFGTGYSSLRYVQELPLDTLKIDRSFVAAAADGGRSEQILASMVRLAHDLGLTVVAEGVEDAECLERVRALGVDAAQGWHLGRPSPAPDFETLLG